MSKFLQSAAAAVNGQIAAAQAEAPAFELVEFPLDKLAAEAPAQTRVMLDVDAVADYARDMSTEEGLAEFLRFPVHLFEDADGTVRISRGHTRIAAARQAGMTHYPARLYKGDARAAVVHALGDNAQHGKKRSRADLLHELDMVLLDPELAKWTDREIARRVRCSHTAVGDRRAYWKSQGEIQDTGERVRTDRHGNTGTINVAAISAANTARTQAQRPLDDAQTFSVINRGLAQSQTGTVEARLQWLREHDGPKFFVAPPGFYLDDATFARQWQRAFDDLSKHLPKPKAGAQPTAQPTAQPASAAVTSVPSNFVPAIRPGSVEWNKRQHEALGVLDVYLPDVMEAIKTIAPLLQHTFDCNGYNGSTANLLGQVKELLDRMESDRKVRADAGNDE